MCVCVLGVIGNIVTKCVVTSVIVIDTCTHTPFSQQWCFYHHSVRWCYCSPFTITYYHYYCAVLASGKHDAFILVPHLRHPHSLKCKWNRRDKFPSIKTPICRKTTILTRFTTRLKCFDCATHALNNIALTSFHTKYVVCPLNQQFVRRVCVHDMCVTEKPLHEKRANNFVEYGFDRNTILKMRHFIRLGFGTLSLSTEISLECDFRRPLRIEIAYLQSIDPVDTTSKRKWVEQMLLLSVWYEHILMAKWV